LLVAWTTLVAFTALGWVTGWLAQRIVEEEVRGQMAAELAGARPAAETRKAA
jgi:hypothetical protein